MCLRSPSRSIRHKRCRAPGAAPSLLRPRGAGLATLALPGLCSRHRWMLVCKSTRAPNARPRETLWTCAKCSQVGTGQWPGHGLPSGQRSSPASGWARSTHSHCQPGENKECLGRHRLLPHHDYGLFLELITKFNQHSLKPFLSFYSFHFCLLGYFLALSFFWVYFFFLKYICLTFSISYHDFL